MVSPVLTRLLVVLSVFSVVVIGRNIVIDVQAPWKRYSTSVIAEVAEFIGEESNDLFWKYVDEMCAQSDRVELALSEGNHETGTDMLSLALDVGSSIVSPSMLPLMTTTLELGGNLPAVRFYESLSESYDQPCRDKAFVVTYPTGRVLCSVHNITEYFSQDHASIASDHLNTPLDTDWDHIHPRSSPLTVDQHIGGSVVLYGSIGTPDFCGLHSALAGKASETGLGYAVRHAFHGFETLSNSSRIQGYGIFLDIKNVEYKTFDDSDSNSVVASGKTSTEQVSFTEDEEVAGVVFSTVAKRRPDVVDGLSVLRAELTNKIVEDGSEMKVYDCFVVSRPTASYHSIITAALENQGTWPATCCSPCVLAVSSRQTI
jgi:hypothetical protein